jgi:hypothetical protein
MVMGLKVAVTERGADIVSVQVVAVPVQAPPQPANTEPALATATNVTGEVEEKLALQRVPQLMPGGIEVTVPVPVPARVTVTTLVVVDALNVAVTERAADMLTLHVDAVPVQAPPQPANVEPAAGDAVSVTVVPIV